MSAPRRNPVTMSLAGEDYPPLPLPAAPSSSSGLLSDGPPTPSCASSPDPPAISGMPIDNTMNEVIRAPFSPCTSFAPHDKIHLLRFNQDNSSLAVLTDNGYRLFSLTSLEKLTPVFAADCGPISILERLFSASLFVLVLKNQPRKLMCWHFVKGNQVSSFNYSQSILSVRVNRTRCCVVIYDSITIHNIRDMKPLHIIKDTPPNPLGVCALSPNADNNFLAYPGSSVTGEVHIFNAIKMTSKCSISAHESPLAAMAFSRDGNLLATASEKGTVIRVFNVNDRSKVTEFRRGAMRCAQIQSLSFSWDSQFLVLTSNTETIHVFRFEGMSAEAKEMLAGRSYDDPSGPTGAANAAQAAAAAAANSWSGYFSSLAASTASYLPATVTEKFLQPRSAYTVTIPDELTRARFLDGLVGGGSAPAAAAGAAAVPGHPANTLTLPQSETAPVLYQHAAVLARIGNMQRLVLATLDGYLYIYDFPPVGSDSTECTLARCFNLKDFTFPSHPKSIPGLDLDLDTDFEPEPEPESRYDFSDLMRRREWEPERRHVPAKPQAIQPEPVPEVDRSPEPEPQLNAELKLEKEASPDDDGVNVLPLETS